MLMLWFDRDSLVFFFQAEDGIRDHCVTGVQTCALPISLCAGTRGTLRGKDRRVTRCGFRDIRHISKGAFGLTFGTRSEERRVGKECRFRWSSDHEKEE